MLRWLQFKCKNQKKEYYLTMSLKYIAVTHSILYTIFSTFPKHMTHYGTPRKFSLPAVSATSWWQALNNSWMRYTSVCGTYTKYWTAELLIVKWIQLLLVFKVGGFNHHRKWQTLIQHSRTTPLTLEYGYHLQAFPMLSILGFPLHCQNIWQVGQSCQEKCTHFWNCLNKVNRVTLVVQEMQKSTKGSPKLLYLPELFLHSKPFYLGH